MLSMTTERLPGESYFQYHKRLIEGKVVNKTLNDVDYSELSSLVYGQQFSSDVARRMMYGSARTLGIVSDDAVEAMPDAEKEDIQNQIIELQKERQKFFDQRSAFNKLVRERARQEEVNELIVKAVANPGLPILDHIAVDGQHDAGHVVEHDMLVSLNDIHYGADIDNHWNIYNSDECRKKFDMYLARISDIQMVHRCRNCFVWQNGDAISGNIHNSIAVTNKENVIEQIIGVSELISQFLCVLSHMFENVYYVSVSGNHSRIDKKDRALKDERLDDLVEWYLKARLQNFNNIVFDYEDKIDSTMYVLKIRGNNYIGVHGDFDASNASIMALQSMANRDVYAVLVGHRHHNMVDTRQGIKIIMAGSFMGMDDLCVERRIYSKPEQIVCICDDTGIECLYDIQL